MNLLFLLSVQNLIQFNYFGNFYFTKMTLVYKKIQTAVKTLFEEKQHE